jgi:DNA-binding IclR family transcriptional regulator
MPPTKAMKCRQRVYSILKKRPQETVTLSELVREKEFPSSLFYRSAKALVRAGLAERSDVETPRHLIGLRFIPEWGKSKGRKW